MRYRLYTLVQSISIVAIFVVLANAQSGSSVVSGIIKDASDATIPGAVVKLTNLETGIELKTTTNESGLYRIGAVIPGSYRLEAGASGFDPAKREPVTVQVSQTVILDLILPVGHQSETIVVTETAPLIESQSADVGQTITRQHLEALPLPSRAASSLAALAPGVVMIDAGTGTAENYPVFSVAGGRARNQNFVLDGGNVSNAVGLTRNQQLTSLPVDAMQEFKVIANNYSAEYGHSTGGIVTMSTRSGTNQLHGSVFEFLRNDVLDARNFFATKKPPIRLNQFGGSFGGPIRRDRTHFFATWERTRQVAGDTLISTVPTLANRRGDFSDLRNSSGQLVRIYDPATTSGTTRLAFEDNRIPTERLDPVAVAALKFYPLPNRPGTITNSNNYVGNSTNRLDRDIIVGRLDHQLRANDLLTARYYINNSGTYSSGTYGIPVSDPLADITDVRVQSILGAYTHVFNSSIINDLRFTYLRRKFIDTRPGYKRNLASQIGLKGVSDAAFPAFVIPGYATLGNPAAVFRFQTPIIDKQVIDSISWSHGKHAWKFGGELRLGANNEIRDRGSAGDLTISPLITGIPGVPNTGNALASFLLGEVNAGSVQVSDKIPSRASYLAFYAQDDWRIFDRLTINYGLRWETEFPRRVVGNRMNSFDAGAINPVSGTLGVVTFAGVNGTPERAFATDSNNFGPRFGLAYRLPGARETVLRAGAGILFGPTVSNTIGDTASLGFSTTASFVVPQADLQSAFRLRDGFPTVARPPLTPAFGAVPRGQKPNTAVSFFNPKQVAPISYQYNLDVQREVARGLLFEIGYIGNVSQHLTANDFSLNQVPPELMGPGDAQSRRPFPQFSNVTWINPSIGSSTYNAGFIRAEKRLSGSFSFLAHYTFSKFLDDVESANEYGSTGSYMDAYHRNLDKGLSGSDVPHHFVLTLLYEIRGFQGKHVMDALFGGWKVGLLQTYQSGPTLTVVTTANTTNAFPAGLLRPNLLRNPTLPSDQRSIVRWFDTAAFAAPPFFTFGNSPRSGVRGPGLITTDLTLEKAFRLNERWKFDLRGEFFNLLNHANFNLPGATFGAADFGVISSARPGRSIQLGARLSF
ncbi:MAG: carboxypeptidase regulatory-like domain-containing protein [Acidobacteria bacterium]|nr:carboxypeptidase regulatory-like domain-containing protein [Acidobacteriota bacterium]